MSLAALNALYGTTPVTGDSNVVSYRPKAPEGFQSMLDSAMALMDDTNALQEAASREEVAFALGETDNTHDLMVAEQKANIALQYTVAIRDKILESYNTIMNMQI